VVFAFWAEAAHAIKGVASCSIPKVFQRLHKAIPQAVFHEQIFLTDTQYPTPKIK
jgi:hypothetical protein